MNTAIVAEVFRLREEGLKYREIADLLGINISRANTICSDSYYRHVLGPDWINENGVGLSLRVANVLLNFGYPKTKTRDQLIDAVESREILKFRNVGLLALNELRLWLGLSALPNVAFRPAERREMIIDKYVPRISRAKRKDTTKQLLLEMVGEIWRSKPAA